MTLFVTAYLAVLLAELVGDKLVYGMGAIAARYGPYATFGGLFPALILKSGAAVLLGGVIAQLPHPLVVASSATAFFVAAVAIWREPVAAPAGHSPSAPEGRRATARQGAVAAFTTVFFTEWADPGQLAAAALSARFGSPLVIWAAAVAAMMTKAVFAVTLGAALGRVVPRELVRYGAVCLSVGLGLATIANFVL